MSQFKDKDVYWLEDGIRRYSGPIEPREFDNKWTADTLMPTIYRETIVTSSTEDVTVRFMHPFVKIPMLLWDTLAAMVVVSNVTCDSFDVSAYDANRERISVEFEWAASGKTLETEDNPKVPYEVDHSKSKFAPSEVIDSDIDPRSSYSEWRGDRYYLENSIVVHRNYPGRYFSANTNILKGTQFVIGDGASKWTEITEAVSCGHS